MHNMERTGRIEVGAILTDPGIHLLASPAAKLLNGRGAHHETFSPAISGAGFQRTGPVDRKAQGNSGFVSSSQYRDLRGRDSQLAERLVAGWRRPRPTTIDIHTGNGLTGSANPFHYPFQFNPAATASIAATTAPITAKRTYRRPTLSAWPKWNFFWQGLFASVADRRNCRVFRRILPIHG